jgi:hypothetical protein
LKTRERNILRSIYGPVVGQGIWRIRNYQELQEMYKNLDIGTYIKNKRLEWIGYIVRMDHGRVVESKPRVKEDGKTKTEMVGRISGDEGAKMAAEGSK